MMERKKNAHGFNAITVYECLRDEILTLKMTPGDLVDETTLAARFEVSRSPVREALVRLTSESLLQTLPNRGTIVSPLRIEEFPQYVDALDILQRATTRLAAQFRTEEHLELIRKQQHQFSLSVANNDVLKMIQNNKDFHVAIAKAANNRYLEDAYAKLLEDGRRFLRLYFKSLGDTLPLELSEDHDGIINAIANQDIHLAEELAHKHILAMQSQFLAYLGTRRMEDFLVEL